MHAVRSRRFPWEPESARDPLTGRAGRCCRIARLAFLVLLATGLSGCFCRQNNAEQGDWKNLWNRNQVVADPTLAGNLIGTFLGVPPSYLTFGVLLPLRLESSERYQRACGKVMDVIVKHTALAGGALFGTSFIPLSLLFEEDPEYCWAD